jgi:tripartite-type tricarboxylate transporter receptor subunit TctC
MVMVAKDKQKFPSVAALIAAAKQAPGTITYTSSGEGSPQHLAGIMFETRTKTKLLHVPYRGGALAINDTIAGTVDIMFAVMPEAVPHVKANKLINKLVQTAFDAELKAKLSENGIEVSTSTPEEVSRQITSDIKLHAELIKAAGIAPQ